MSLDLAHRRSARASMEKVAAEIAFPVEMLAHG
jgi:hypothetical protein